MMSITDSIVAAADAAVPSMNTVTQETADVIFTDDELNVLHSGMLETLTPEEARDVLSAQYGRVISGKVANQRPTRELLRRLVVLPFFVALPSIVAHDGNSETSKMLVAELITILVGLRRATGGNLVELQETYDARPDDLSNNEDFVTSVRYTVFAANTELRIGPTLATAYRSICEAYPDSMVALADGEILQKRNAEDPVQLLNALAEFRQYATSVSFKIKLEGQQLKMLQAFFRAS